MRRSPAAHPPPMAALPLAGLLWLGVLLLGTTTAQAEGSGRMVAPQGVAVGGFDPVAYFRDGQAAAGNAEIALRWRGVRWHFATPAHRAAFEANPRAFLPQFGGYCVVSVAQGRPEPADPAHWIIVDGRLYLTARAAALEQFRSAPAQWLEAARSHWSGWAKGP